MKISVGTLVMAHRALCVHEKTLDRESAANSGTEKHDQCFADWMLCMKAKAEMGVLIKRLAIEIEVTE